MSHIESDVETYSGGDWRVEFEEGGVLNVDVSEHNEWTSLELSHQDIVMLLARVSDEERDNAPNSDSDNAVEFLQVTGENVRAWRSGVPVPVDDLLTMIGSSVVVALLGYLAELAEARSAESQASSND